MGLESTKKEELAARAADLATALLAGQGSVEERTIVRTLPKGGPIEPPPSDIMMGAKEDIPALPIEASCTALFPALQLAPPEAPLSQTLADLWSRTVAGREQSSKRLRCQLSVKSLGPVMEGVSMISVQGTLQCGEERFQVNVPSISIPKAHQGLAKRLAEKLLATICQRQT
jgi:hypothetical protein